MKSKSRKIKSSNDDLFAKLKAFDDKYIEGFLKEYNKIPPKYEAIDQQHQGYRELLLNKINDEYYTFSRTPKKSRLSFIKSFIYEQLFKFVHKQIFFNDYLKSIVQIFNDDLFQLKQEVSSLSEIERRENKKFQHVHDALTEVVARTNALQEMNRLNHITSKNVTVSQGSKIFYSQFGEDQWIVNNIDLPKTGIFVDIGAADGIVFSNTYYFEKQGWSGVCFEPNPENYLLAKKYRGKVVNKAISNTSGESLFLIDESSADWSRLIESKKGVSSKKANTIKVKTDTLSNIINGFKNEEVTLLSIDTEGTELDVLATLGDCKVLPKIIVVEFFTNLGDSDQKSEIISLISDYPYSLGFQTKSNLIFLRK